MPSTPELYRVYRLRGADDWAIRVREQTVEIREGARAQPARYKAIPREECAGQDPVTEMERRTKEQAALGYRSLGPGDFPGNRLRLVSGAAPARLDLEWVPLDRVSRRGFDRVIARLAVRLRDAGVEATAVLNRDGGIPVLSVPCGQDRWGIGLTSGNRLSGVFAGASRAVPAPLGTVPVLVLVYLREKYPQALTLSLEARHRPSHEEPAPRLAHADYWLGDEVAPYADTFRFGMALGIQPAPLGWPVPLPLLTEYASAPAMWF